MSLWASVTLSADNFLNKLCQEFCKQCKEAEDSYKESCDKMWSQLSLELFNDADQFKEVQQEQGEFLTPAQFLNVYMIWELTYIYQKIKYSKLVKKKKVIYDAYDCTDTESEQWYNERLEQITVKFSIKFAEWFSCGSLRTLLSKCHLLIKMQITQSSSVRVEKSLINEDKSLHKVNNSSDNYFSLSFLFSEIEAWPFFN